MSRFGRIAVAVALVFRVEAQTSRMDDYGKIIGAISCSDGSSQQDSVVAKAGADALAKMVSH